MEGYTIMVISSHWKAPEMQKKLECSGENDC